VSEIGAAIQAERHAANMTQAALARQAGISRPYLANIERGAQLPTTHTLLCIADVFPDVDSAGWLWRLLVDLWGRPIADAMKARVAFIAKHGGCES
jgi:transcriptional regulator with XRE-family HTH domain